MTAPPSIERWKRAEAFWAARQAELARREYDALLSDPDWMLPANLRLGAIALETGQVRAAVSHALAAFYAREPDPPLLEALCRLLLNVGETRSALHCVDDASVAACAEPRVLVGFGRMMAEHGFFDRAASLLRRARGAGLDSAELRLLLGNAESQAGNVAAAEAELEACLAASPQQAAAHVALSALRRATHDHNHVARLRGLLERMPETHADAPRLQFALFKELDDLGDTDAAWPALAAGLRLRHRRVRYIVADEVAMFENLHKVRAAPPSPAEPGPAPIFIVGLPQSGAAFLESLLATDPRIVAVGELSDLVTQLRWCAQRIGGTTLDGELVRACAGADLSPLARRYLGHTQWRAAGKDYFVDRTPGHFLALGYLANAMPNARFVHLRREPMDACFANLRQLFAQGDGYSYDQAEMAGYHGRYRALMAHWHAQFPGRILDVAFETMVTDPYAVARKVFEHVGLDFTPAPVRALDGREVGQWRRYEDQLQPLKAALGLSA
ncbi:MAG: sulfotransferase [Arenimonas sp.]|uniref:tetratricopeptide repeat-containing sulfotransferase family protein n=1 Tax=Arenimonas sp. TaxID=1872635 RepID=UPI0025BAD6EC|nr:sulfotransferase [Arenimonas sp.]MBW8368075.1 sulfotransferase [Arenimonas sp.]